MILLLRALARLAGFLLLASLAVIGLALAGFSIQAGSGALSLVRLSDLVHLPDLRDTVGAFLGGLESRGPTARVAALSGAGAVLLGVALLAGALIPRGERLLVTELDSDGRLAARRRAVAQAVRAVAEQPRDVQRASARVRPRRTGTGGRLRLTVYRTQTSARRSVLDATATTQLAALSETLSLHLRTRGRVPRRGSRGSPPTERVR